MQTSINRRSFLLGAALAGTAVVGGLTGCTPKSQGKAGGEIQLDSETVDPSQITKTFDYEVVVCGAGTGGLTAAGVAAANGAHVACLEKCSKPCSGGFNYGFINSQYLLDAGCSPTDTEALFDNIIKAHMGNANPQLVRMFIDSNPEVGDWFTNIAIQTGHSYNLASLEGIPVTNFDNALAILSDNLQNNNGELICAMSACQLVTDATNKVTGVIAQNTETQEYVQYNASKGVVLATGGISGNSDAIRKYLPYLDPETLVDCAPNSAEGGENGDAIHMAEGVGALIPAGMFSEQIHYTHGYWPQQGILFVDKAGKRLPNNEIYCDYNEVRVHTIMSRSGHSSWAITDSKDGWGEMDNIQAAIRPDYAAVKANSFDTLDDVASEFNLDAAGLKATVEEWNAMVANRNDPLYQTDLAEALTLDTPPFHAVEAKGVSYALMGGPLVNEKLQVVRDDYTAIDGLYAIGNCCCGFWGPDYIMSLWAGMNKSWSTVTGYLAGNTATKQ